jgi:hypothetical protein
MQQRTIISLFDRTTNMAKPWAEAGYTCYCVDLQHRKTEREGNIIKVKADVLEWTPPECYMAFFFPPCTNTSVSGARWFKEKGLDGLIEALTLFNRSIKLGEELGAPYMIENPVSTVSTYWRQPDYTFQPWEYGDLYTKKTCLWTGNGFIMPEPVHKTEPPGVDQRIWKMAPSLDRANKRSATPMGFAKAVFEANHDSH